MTIEMTEEGILMCEGIPCSQFEDAHKRCAWCPMADSIG